MASIEPVSVFKVRIDCNLEKMGTDGYGGRTYSGERLTFGEQFEFEARDFGEVAQILGSFQRVAERIRLEGHARFQDEG